MYANTTERSLIVLSFYDLFLSDLQLFVFAVMPFYYNIILLGDVYIGRIE
mgnify:CR=1 FL=1